MALKRAFLEVVSGPGQGRRVVLRKEQVRYVGRTDQADVSFPENPELSSVHFSLRWLGDQCEIKDLHSANGTWRGGAKITEALLRAGEEIKAGKAVFRFVIEDEAADRTGRETTIDGHRPPEPVLAPAAGSGSPAAPVPPAGAQVPAPPAWPRGLAVASASAICQAAPLDDAAKTLLHQEMPVADFLDLLASRELFLDALRAVAYALTKRSAVDWACRCVRLAQGDDLSPRDKAALDAAEAWVADPTEEARRKAEAAAAAAAHETAAAWAAMAAVWSGGSLAPPHAPVVSPGPTLTPHAAGGAVMLAAVARQPEKAKDKYLEFLRIGKELMQPQPQT